jgi:hypothetical protein
MLSHATWYRPAETPIFALPRPRFVDSCGFPSPGSTSKVTGTWPGDEAQCSCPKYYVRMDAISKVFTNNLNPSNHHADM